MRPDSVNVVEVRNWATDYSAVDDSMLIEQLIQRVLAKRGSLRIRTKFW